MQLHQWNSRERQADAVALMRPVGASRKCNYFIIIIFPLRDRRWAQQKFSVTYQEVRLWGGYVDG